MHRVDTDGHKNNRFDEGDPNTGRLPTQLGADWLNDLQENIAKAVEDVEELKKGDQSQLQRAIRQCGHQGISVERNPNTVTFRGNSNKESYDDASYTELGNGVAEGRTGIRATASGGKPSLQLWGIVGGNYVPIWRAGSDGSGSVSDARLKERKGDLSSSKALRAARAIRAEWFTWKGDCHEAPTCGLVAQEILKALETAGIPTEPFVAVEDGLLVPNRESLLALLFTAFSELVRSLEHGDAKK